MNGLDIRAERKWMESHPGQVLDEAEIVPYELPLGREKVLRFEAALAKMPQFECPLRHNFVDGLYVREIFIPAGVAVTGYIHMFPCITIVSMGKIMVSEDDNNRLIEAPFTMTCEPGTKKALYALTDTVWSDAYLNIDNERNIDALESRLIANTHREYLERSRSTIKVLK